MSTRTVNTTLFLLVIAQWFSGAGSFLAGTPSGRWVVWLHGAGGFAILVLLLWKGRVILRSFRRRRPGWWAAPSLALLLLLLLTLATGVLWSTTGLPSLGSYSALTVHTLLSVAMLPLFLPHVGRSRPRPRPAEYLDRRRLLRRTFVAAAGVAAWRAGETVSDAAALSGADRRFTGSRAVTGDGAAFPRTSWLLDDPPPLDLAGWRLRVDGAVRAPLSLALAQLPATTERTVTLDCTGGWYAERLWRGVALAQLLTDAGSAEDARSVVVHSATGYARRFPLHTARRTLLAVAVGPDPLGHGHGAPLRLVVPGRRGYDWVKWVTRIEVSRVPSWWNWPLPVR